MDLDQLDAEKFGPMVVLTGGERHVLPPATSLPWKAVAAILGNPHYFVLGVWPAKAPIKAWQIETALEAWRLHNGLPTAPQVQRLAFMVERYGDGIEYDLRRHLGVSMRELWQARRWRELLGYIDQLPADTHKNRMMLLDEEYMREALKAGGSGESKPSQAEFSQEARLLADLIDAVKRNTAVTAAAAGSKGQPDLTPAPRPATVLAKLDTEIRRAEHEEMKSLLLRDR